MKRIFFLVLALLIGVLSFTSCKDSGSGRKKALPAVTGATNQLLVVMPKALWQGAMGDTIKQFFGQEQAGLPQSEPIFDLMNLPASSFDKHVKAHRNVLVVSISSKVDSATLTFFESPWANTQKLFKITAPNAEAFYKIFDANKEKLMGVYLKAERDRLIDVYKKASNEKVFNLFKNKYDLLLYCPGSYRINKETSNFAWLSFETRVDSRGIIFFQEPYEHQNQLEYQVILERVNEELQKNIPGPRDSTWMTLDTKTPITAAHYNYEGKYYAMLLKGLWKAQNDFMGGPFVLNVVLDEKNNRVIYMMGYVYAPESKKRNMLRQVESILFSMQIDMAGKETQKTK